MLSSEGISRGKDECGSGFIFLACSTQARRAGLTEMHDCKNPQGPYLVLAEALADAIEHVVKDALGQASTPAGNATMVSVPEAAQRLGLAKTKVNELIARGALPSVVV